MKKNIILWICIISMQFIACQKEYLAKKPDNSLLIPTTLADFQTLLQNMRVFNFTPSLTLVASDDFYATDATLNTVINNYERNSYLWAKNIDEGATLPDWNYPYQQIYYANVILDGLMDLSPQQNADQYNQIKGSALFHRAFAYYNLSQQFSPAYSAGISSQPLGVPIRTVSLVTAVSKRSTIQEMYDQIIADLRQAITLLPASSATKNLPDQVAANALLARAYLVMGQYENAIKYATASLTLNGQLLDYNTLSKTSSNPFPASPATNNNPEVIFYSQLANYGTLSSAAQVSEELYNSYNLSDLRKTIFFVNKGGGVITFKGKYTGSSSRQFGGITTVEVYYIRAECYARTNQLDKALSDLNTVMSKRWISTSTNVPYSSTNRADVLQWIMTERRKELVFKGLRWSDLRRLNQETVFAKIITHTYNGQQYTLLPLSNRYTFPIPLLEINASGIEQNP